MQCSINHQFRRNIACVFTKLFFRNISLPLRGKSLSPLQTENEILIFQRDEVTHQYANVVCEFMNDKFPRSWKGRGGWHSCPTRSLTLPPKILCMWVAVLKDTNTEKKIKQC